MKICFFKTSQKSFEKRQKNPEKPHQILIVYCIFARARQNLNNNESQDLTEWDNLLFRILHFDSFSQRAQATAVLSLSKF